jgi:hypothetical protein
MNQPFREPMKGYKSKHCKILITGLPMQLDISPATGKVSYDFTHVNHPLISPFCKLHCNLTTIQYLTV